MRSFVASGGLFAAGMTAAVVLLLTEHGVISVPGGSRRAALGLAVGGIVLVVAAHDRALTVLPDKHRITGQLPLLLAMVAFTVGGLYLLFAA